MRLSSGGNKIHGTVGKSCGRLIFAAVAIFGTAASPALEWDANLGTPGAQGGSGSWNTASNWWNGAQNVAWPNSDAQATAVFGGVAGTVEVAGMYANHITFNSPYRLTAAGDYLYLRAGATITVPSAGSGAEIAAPVVPSPSGFSKEGSGTLSMPGGIRSNTAVVTVNGGTLAAGVAGAYNHIAKLTVAANGTMRLLGGFDINEISGTGLLDIGAHRLIVGKIVLRPWPPQDPPVPNPSVPFFDGKIIGSGEVKFHESVTISPAANGSSFTGAVTILNPYDGVPTIVTVPSLANAGVNSALGAGSQINLDNAGTLAISGSGTMSSNRSFMLGDAPPVGGSLSVNDANAVLTLNGVVGGFGGKFEKLGPGTLVLAGENTFRAILEANGGTLVAANAASVPDGTKLSVGPLGTFKMSAFEKLGELKGAGAVDLGAHNLLVEWGGAFSGVIKGTGVLQARGDFDFSLEGSRSTFTGGVSIVGNGSVKIDTLGMTGSAGPLGSAGLITLGDVAQSGRLVVTNPGAHTTNRSIAIQDGGGILEISNAGGELALHGSLSGNSSLEKRGAGRLRLVDNKDFTGRMTVSNGVLDFDGNASAPVTVMAAGGLETSGVVPRSIGSLLLEGGSLSIGGNGVAALLNTQSLTLNGGVFALDLQNAAGGHDQLNVTGSVSLGAPISLTINLGFDPVDDSAVFA
ncbi:MAG: autotransporter-associated beta strand repeat-containing protein [Chthoniobacteraceae bacterium]